jgi:hypothetical protein
LKGRIDCVNGQIHVLKRDTRNLAKFRGIKMSDLPPRTKPLELALSDSQRDALKHDLLSIVYPDQDFDMYVEAIKEISNYLKSILSPLDRFLATNSHPDERPGAIKLTNLPVSDSVVLPPLNHADLIKIHKESYISENVLTAIAV